MIVAFYTPLEKKITVNIDNVQSIYTLPKNAWTIINKVVDINQLVGYNKLLKDNIQIYSGKWSDTPFFGINTLINIIGKNSKIEASKNFIVLRESNSDAILEFSNAKNIDTLSYSDDQGLNIFGNKILEINNGLIASKLEKGSTPYNDYLTLVASKVLTAKIDYLAGKNAPLQKYSAKNFKNDKFVTINDFVIDDTKIIATLNGLKNDTIVSREKVDTIVAKFSLGLNSIKASSLSMSTHCKQEYDNIILKQVEELLIFIIGIPNSLREGVIVGYPNSSREGVIVGYPNGSRESF